MATPKVENPLAVGGAVIGGALIAVSVFMPIAERTGPFAYIQQNSLIQHGGWLVLVAGIGVAATAVRAAIGKEKPWWPIVSSLIAGAFVLRVVTNDKLRTLYPLNSDGEPDATVGGMVAPLGLAGYVAGVGAAIALISAVALFAQRQDSGSKALIAQWDAEDAAEEAAHVAAKHKQCPDCAETVLAAANVCKHCGYRFSHQGGHQ